MSRDLASYDVAAPARTEGPYEIIAPLGRGRTTDVVLALASNERGSKKKVVLKSLRLDLSDDPDLRATFAHQARVAVKLRHPHLVETVALDRLGDRDVMVMEYLDGQPLSRIRQRPNVVTAVPLSIHLRVLSNVLGALQYLHEVSEEEAPDGIVHGDVRPDNIFVTYDGSIKLLHAGIDVPDADTRFITERLSYTSPERARDEPIDRRCDVFAVGVMLWEAVTGLRFWQDWHQLAIFRRLCSRTLPLHPQWVPIASDDLFAIAERAIAADPDERYESAAKMQADIDEVLARPENDAPRSVIRSYMEVAFAEERAGANEQAVVVEPTAPDDTPPTDISPTDPDVDLVDSSPGWTTSPSLPAPPGPRSGLSRRALYSIAGIAAILSGAWLVSNALRESKLVSVAAPTASSVRLPEPASSKSVDAPSSAPLILPCPIDVPAQPRIAPAPSRMKADEIRRGPPPKSPRPTPDTDKWGI
jgi:serine/threonine-protein kinase